MASSTLYVIPLVVLLAYLLMSGNDDPSGEEGLELDSTVVLGGRDGGGGSAGGELEYGGDGGEEGDGMEQGSETSMIGNTHSLTNLPQTRQLQRTVDA